MATKELKTWADFKGLVTDVVADREEKRKVLKGYVSPALYRGHANAQWKLESTLERAGHHGVVVEDYYHDVRTAHGYISNFGHRDFTLADSNQMEIPPFDDHLENYEFIAYLRHHGFLSPLIDWSQSPYVAAYFAFADAGPEVERVAIYVYQELYGNGKLTNASKGAIHTQGPYATIHERHVLQQSWYTYCDRTDRKMVDGYAVEKRIFSSHEEVIAAGESDPNNVQDLLVKFTIPRSERLIALKDLLLMNITPYSLFHSTDALVRTAGMRIFDKLSE